MRCLVTAVLVILRTRLFGIELVVVAHFHSASSMSAADIRLNDGLKHGMPVLSLGFSKPKASSSLSTILLIWNKAEPRHDVSIWFHVSMQKDVLVVDPLFRCDHLLVRVAIENNSQYITGWTEEHGCMLHTSTFCTCPPMRIFLMHSSSLLVPNSFSKEALLAPSS